MAGAVAAATVLAMAAGGCNYSFRAGGGFPEHIRTVAILPFENETTRFELTQEVHDQLLRELPRALGIRNAGEENADAIVRGTIRNYSLDAPLYRAGAEQSRTEVLQRSVRIVVTVQIIDRQENVILWESRSLSAEGQYLEATEQEDTGREEAISLLVQRIVDGAQSNW